MPNTITMLNDLIDPEVMADMISANVKNKVAFLPYAKVDTTLEGNEGDTISIPRFEHMGPAVEVGEGEQIPLRKIQATVEQYKIKKIAIGVSLTDEAVLSGHGNIVGEATKQIGESMEQKADYDVVDELYKAKTIYLGQKIGHREINHAIDLFAEQRNSEKVIWVDPHQVTQLRDDPMFLDSSTYDNKVLVNGEIGKILNCRVVPSRKVRHEGHKFWCPIVKLNSDNEDEDEAPAITIFVKRETNVEKERQSLTRTTIISADKLYVTALTNESKVVVAKLDDNAVVLSVEPSEVEVEEGEESEALTITEETGATVEMVSENDEIATINATTKVITGVAPGKTRIRISASLTDKETSVAYVEVTVTEAGN